MRLIAGLTAAALSGIAAGASQQSADVYLFQPSPSQQSSAEIPSIPKEVARHILLQRTSRQRYGSDLRDIPNSIDTETAVDYIARFGKNPAPLFTHSETTGASQLVVIIEGAAAEQSSQLKEKLGQHAAFTISDPPSAAANNDLMALFHNLGIVAPAEQCRLPAIINPFLDACWTGSSSVVKYDLRKPIETETLDYLFDNLSRLNRFVTDGDLEVLLVLLPESSRSSKLNHWSAAAAGTRSSASDLRRRRDAETVISDNDEDNRNPPTAKSAAAAAAPGSSDRRPPSKSIPQCFASFNTCMNQTNNCSGHGECANKYGGKGDDAAAAAVGCFACACKATVVHTGKDSDKQGRKTVHWGGNKCQKEDISVQFWLLAGFTVTITGAVAFAIGLLFSVGQETLPGVIGAGVSRSK